MRASKSAYIPLRPLVSAKIVNKNNITSHMSGNITEIIPTTKDHKDAGVVVPIIYVFNSPVSFLQQLDGSSKEIIGC